MTHPSLSLTKLNISVRGLANWILDYADSLNIPITNMALNKLIYFAYERTLFEKSQVITNAKIEAWEHGPVFREVYQDFKKFGDQPIEDRSCFFSLQSGEMEIAECSLEADTEEYLKKVLDPFLPLTASRLRNLSHIKGGAWDKVWSYEGNSNPGMEITPDVILETVFSQGDN
ncbi:MAG: Panacea domain-containing protein [Sphingobium sp.]